MRIIEISESGGLPDTSHLAPFCAAVIIDKKLSARRQFEVSRWLCDMGCLYMCAWGVECSTWDDSVDLANLEHFNFGEIPDDNFVMTTWHTDDSLDEFFEYVNLTAIHPTIDLKQTLIVHIGGSDRRAELCAFLEAT